MALPTTGVPFVPATQEEIRDQILADYRLEAQRLGITDVAVQPGTDIYRWAMSHAGIAMLQFANIDLSKSGITPLNATGQDLEDWREALGLPVVQPSPSTGKIVIRVNGTSSIANGEPIVLPNGLRAKVVGTFLSVVDKAEIDVQSVDTGDAANMDALTEVRFINPPTNVSEKATVSRNAPLRGGTDSESEERKRLRVLNAVANKPGGGNWAQLRQAALDALANVQDCYVYPALGGPGSVKVVPVRDLDPDESDFTRALNNAAVNLVANAVYQKTCDGVEVVVQTAQDQPCDVALQVSIPSSSLSGGNGQGWVDQAPWPALDEGSPEVAVEVSVVITSRQITVSAATTILPVAGQTHIAWWSPVDRRFNTYLVTSISGLAGAWGLELDRPLTADDGTTVAVGDFICPAAVNGDAYGKSWVSAMRKLGPGENTEDPNRTPRALRHPYVADESPSALSFETLRLFQSAHAEISDLDYAKKSPSKPSVPATVSDPPNALVPRHFALYPQ